MEAKHCYYKVDFVEKNGKEGYILYKCAKADAREILNNAWLTKRAVAVKNVELLFENMNIHSLITPIDEGFLQISELARTAHQIAVEAGGLAELTWSGINAITGFADTIVERLGKLRLFIKCVESWKQEPREEPEERRVIQIFEHFD